MTPRPYQQTTVDSIQRNSVNLCVLPQRSGKSFIFELIIDKLKPSKVLIVVGYRKIVEQLITYYHGRSTHILAGKPFDNSMQVHVASFQTLQSRLDSIDLSQYDLIIQDEYHSRTSKQAQSIVFQPDTTICLFTGTPLTNSNKLITDRIDNFIQPTSVRELLENNWLAPTRFMSNRDIIGSNSELLQTNRQDFDESVVRQLISREGLLASIRKLILDNQLDTQHNTVIYVNYIDTADTLFTQLSDLHNVNLVHSKLSANQQQQALANYESDFGVLINVRALSLGWDSPRTDRLIYSFFTKIHSLALQILWRSSTVNPDDPHKQAVVYDLTGQLASVNPYTDFKQYSKKPSCRKQCEKLTNPMEKFFCLASCVSEPPMSNCTGKLPYSLTDNPYVSNFTVHAGKPCGESVPVHQMQFKSTEPSVGIVRKWSKCKCGCVTYYDIQTLVNPSEMIELYSEESPTNCVTVLYSSENKQALAILDDPGKSTYSFKQFTDSSDLYQHAVKYFKSKPFQIISNARSKLPNVHVDTELNFALDLVNWDGSNQNLIRKLIKSKLLHICEYLGMKPGVVYYKMKLVTTDNQKSVLNFLNSENITRAKLMKFFNKYED